VLRGSRKWAAASQGIGGFPAEKREDRIASPLSPSWREGCSLSGAGAPEAAGETAGNPRQNDNLDTSMLCRPLGVIQ